MQPSLSPPVTVTGLPEPMLTSDAPRTLLLWLRRQLPAFTSLRHLSCCLGVQSSNAAAAAAKAATVSAHVVKRRPPPML